MFSIGKLNKKSNILKKFPNRISGIVSLNRLWQVSRHTNKIKCFFFWKESCLVMFIIRFIYDIKNQLQKSNLQKLQLHSFFLYSSSFICPSFSFNWKHTFWYCEFTVRSQPFDVSWPTNYFPHTSGTFSWMYISLHHAHGLPNTNWNTDKTNFQQSIQP